MPIHIETVNIQSVQRSSVCHSQQTVIKHSFAVPDRLYIVVSQYIGKVLRLNGDGTCHELRHIIALKELAMEVGVSLRQFECFGNVAVPVDMSKEDTCEHPVCTT